jgi:ATP-binding cassette subfamily A (ABC1) protein 3
MYGNQSVFPNDPHGDAIKFGVAVFLFAIAMIPFSMSLSTFFSDSKLGNQIGGLVLVIPELLFIWLAAKPKPTCYIMYALYVLPVTPACAIFSSLSLNKSTTFHFISVDFVNLPLTWAVLILNIPFWIMIYIYLDSVMPSEFGIQKHPCFCLKKKQKAKLTSGFSPADLEMDQKIYDKNDPILLQGITKKFGDFTAVKNLSFSIKEGEIFTFLGHNGAGKTTTIYMMTGMLNATQGDASIYGFSVNKNIDQVQRNLGLCQ